MRLRFVTVLVLLLAVAPLHAQEKDNLFRLSLVTAVAAHGADLASTENCLGAGRCREMNPFLLRFKQPAVFGTVKMGLAGLQLWGVALLHEKSPKWATVVNFATTGIFFGIAAHNAKVTR